MVGPRFLSRLSIVFSSYATGLSVGDHFDVCSTALRRDSRDWPCRAAVAKQVNSRLQNHFRVIVRTPLLLCFFLFCGFGTAQGTSVRSYTLEERLGNRLPAFGCFDLFFVLRIADKTNFGQHG